MKYILIMIGLMVATAVLLYAFIYFLLWFGPLVN